MIDLAFNEAAEGWIRMTAEEPWKELYRYWRSRQVNGRAPMRSDLDIPIEVPHLVPNIMLAEVIGDGFRYRLVGTAIYDRYQSELTGTWVQERNPPEVEWRDTLAMVRDDQIPRLVSSPLAGQSGQYHIAVAMPLVDDAGRTTQILAGTFFALEYGNDLRVGRLLVRELLDGES